jgi:hypothetical protein
MKLINLFIEKYSEIKIGRDSNVGKMLATKRSLLNSNYYKGNERLFNYKLIRSVLSYKISKIIYDNKIIDNIRKILSIRYNIRRRFHKKAFARITRNLSKYNVFLNALKNADFIEYDTINYIVRINNQTIYSNRRFMLTIDNYYHK